MTRIAGRVLGAALSLLPIGSAAAQGTITSDSSLIRRVLADTALVHDLPAHQSDGRLTVALNVTRAERTAMTPSLVQLSALLRGDSAVRNSRGVWLTFRNELSVNTGGHGRLLTGRVAMTSWPYGILDGGIAYYSAAEVLLQVNPDLCPADENVDGVDFRRAPKFDGRFHGFPMLDSLVVITHRTASPCLPVSCAQVVIALRRQLDGVLPQLDPGDETHARAHALDLWLTQMSPAERAMRICRAGNARWSSASWRRRR
jgi:hypothetical protein